MNQLIARLNYLGRYLILIPNLSYLFKFFVSFCISCYILVFLSSLINRDCLIFICFLYYPVSILLFYSYLIVIKNMYFFFFSNFKDLATVCSAGFKNIAIFMRVCATSCRLVSSRKTGAATILLKK